MCIIDVPVGLMNVPCMLLCFLMTRLPPRSTLFPYTPPFRSGPPARRRQRRRRRRHGRQAQGGARVRGRPRRRLHRTGLGARSEEHTSELQSRQYLVCRLLLETKKQFTYVNKRYTLAALTLAV